MRNTADYGAAATDMQNYLDEGHHRAMSLGNRGPVRFKPDGCLADDISASYSKNGFYIFEGVIDDEELADLRSDVDLVLDRLPRHKGAKVDREGNPALALSCKAPTLFWSKPLGDPLGGTSLANGRHPVKMTEPTPADGDTDEIVFVILGSLQFSPACLRLYGHPDLLQVAASVNGEDFTPFNEALFIKEPGRGASVAWHQDGVTHWDKPDWDEDTHGFNFMGQLYGSTATNGLWVVPGSHKNGKADIAALVDEAGSDRIPEAVPVITKPGDVVITNRQVVHGSFANTSQDWRVTVNFGFHRRASVLDVQGGGVHNPAATYDAERIHRRSHILGLAIDARKQRYPNSPSYNYHPLEGEDISWNPKVDLTDYNLLDLSI